MAEPVSMSELFVREFEKNDGTVLRFNQSEIGDVGCVVWDAALVLSKYLETEDFSGGNDLKSKLVVELGAGTGAVGLVAASLGANVTVTDLPQFVPLMELNIRDNAASLAGTAQAVALTWGTELDGTVPAAPDLVLLADCIYYEESLEPLVKTVHSLCGENTLALCCYEKRDTGNKPEIERRFLQLMGEVFDKDYVPTERQDPHFSSDDIHIIRFTLKKTEIS
ncbi:protein N-lysine methyltransferase METTL21D-like [Babylonia areolata]|uniref:protein N-lysine methyltransferase METTL21D-like n=1 Tax=Babylonia areolata TaxID=304850 RepID=UPI003FCF26A1